MKVKDIIENVCVYLGKEEILDSNIFNANGSEPDAHQIKEVNKMLKCLNNITNEISSDYLPLLKEKKVEFNDGRLNIFDVDDNIQEIISIKSTLGRNLKYKLVDNQIICLANMATITYKVYPEELELNDDAETFSGRLSARVLAYGVASEFCYLEMLYDDATIWETRFKNALFFASRKKGELKLKQRGWY